MPACYQKTVFLVALVATFLFLPKKIFAKIEITGYPQEIEIDKEFAIGVRLTNLSGSHYIAIGIHKEAGKEYFGLTKNNNLWVEMEDDNCANFPLAVVNDEIWDEDLIGKIVYGEEGFDGSLGNYTLKIIKYTEASCLNGKSKSYSDGVTFSLIDLASPSPDSISPTLAPSFQTEINPSPSSVTAVYKINEAKDENGEILSNVKVYLDDVYLHCYAPESLIFCDGWKFDTYLDCIFGEHTISLEKTGFVDWNETKEIEAGGYYEINPIMKPTDSSSSSSPSSTSSPDLTPSPKPTGLTGTTLLGKVLGEEGSSLAGFYPWEATESSESQEVSETGRFKFFPQFLLGLGLVFLIASGISLCYNQARQRK